jgi:hydrogenase maturation protein HypF
LTLPVSHAPRVKKRFRVQGIVQGVGFRPFVYGLATRLELGGFVLNDSAGVLIEVEGPPKAVEEFRETLINRPPPLAMVESVAEEELDPAGAAGFEIVASSRSGRPQAMISPDVATCDACLAELLNPEDRRYRYTFINCTDCGPRFTISKGIPYDRPNTTMSAFPMCELCREEYENPADRRFHAQPIACPVCGPRLSLLDKAGVPIDADPVEATAAMLRGGLVVAVKGLGGYHVACLASDDAAVAALRKRKIREEKPFAVMAKDLEAAMELADLDPDQMQLLASRRRPIVLVARRPKARVAAEVAPRNRFLGVMLPYTPLHHLLLAEVGEPIVLTSGNLSDEPIVFQDDELRPTLSSVADAYLTHDRAIHMRCDDSVVRVVRGGAQPIRRARGYAPEPIGVDPAFSAPTLGAGPEMKHTFCLGVGARAILSHHIGDVENWETMSSFVEGLQHFKRVFEVEPQVVGYDLHPEYLVTKWAQELEGVELFGVQHHHAHIASCLADNRRSQRVIGLALDGTGYGEDGAIWGCEVLIADLAAYRRFAHLSYIPLPGGSAAIRHPWRTASAYLAQAFGERAATLGLDFVRRNSPRWKPILQMAAAGINSPVTSSAGRLFDAAAALAGIRDDVNYEGQAAIELEQAADPLFEGAYRCDVKLPAEGEGPAEIDGPGLIAALAEDLAGGQPVSKAAAAFHNGLAAALVQSCLHARRAERLDTVALSGGTFQNQLLTAAVIRGLEQQGFEVLTHHRVPCNDGGISLGQAMVANARRA